MSKKLTYEYIKYFIEIESNSGCKLISKTYKNKRTKMDFECVCGKKFQTTFHAFKIQNKRQCKECGIRLININNIFTNEYVSQYVKIFGYTLLSKYENTRILITLMCPEGHIVDMSFSNFKNHNNRCGVCNGKHKHSFEFVYNKFIELDMTPLFNTYLNSDKLLPFICNKHPYEIQYGKFKRVIEGINICKHCSKEKRSGENSHHWNGGISKINDVLRDCLKNWIFNSLKHGNFKCVLTNTKKSLNIHHVSLSFKDIRNNFIKEFGLSDIKTIMNFSFNEVESIKNSFIRYHDDFGLGIPINKSLHKLFHSANMYGYKSTNISQFKEFVNRLANGEFNDFLKENNLELNINYEILNKLLNNKEGGS